MRATVITKFVETKNGRWIGQFVDENGHVMMATPPRGLPSRAEAVRVVDNVRWFEGTTEAAIESRRKHDIGWCLLAAGVGMLAGLALGWVVFPG